MTSRDSSDRPGWLVHDVVVGAISGAAAGLVIGLFALSRIDSPLLAGTIIAATVGIAVGLLRWERHRRTGAGAVTVLTWVIMVASIAFLALLIHAIRTFT